MSESTAGTDRQLVAENVRRREANKKYKAEIETLKAQLAERDATIEELSGQVNEFAAAIESLDPETMEAEAEELATLREQLERIGNDPQYQRLAEEIDQLKGTLRDGKHKDAFNRKASELGFNPDALSDVWGMSGYKAESDDPDEAAIEAALKPLYEAKPWLRKPVDTSAEKGQTTQGTAVPTDGKVAPGGAKPLTLPTAAAGVGAGRGTPETGKPLITVEDRVNAKFAETGRRDPFSI